MAIEKHIIQTWKTKTVPRYLERFCNSWKNQLGFSYKIYDDTDINLFVKTNYPNFWNDFQNLKPIEKTDVFRLLIIYHEGGVYTDLDTSCECNLQEFFDKYKDFSFLVGTEINHMDYFQIANWTFAAKKKHPAMKRIIDNLFNHIRKNQELETLEKTGPVIFTTLVLEEASQDTSIKILPIRYFGAGQKHSSSPPKSEGYIIHHFMGSWKRNVSWSKKFRFLWRGLCKNFRK